jgi:hypothetical protein
MINIKLLTKNLVTHIVILQINPVKLFSLIWSLGNLEVPRESDNDFQNALFEPDERAGADCYPKLCQKSIPLISNLIE